MKDKRLAIIFLTVFIDLVGFGIIIPLSPYYARVFDASPFEVGLLMSIYSLLQFIFSPIWGQLSDRYGRRPIILFSLLGAALSHMSFAFASSLTGLMIARGMAGLFGGNISTAMAYIADITDEQNRSKGMGLVGAAFGLGFLCGPLIGGFFAGPPFATNAPAMVAGTICFLNFLFAMRFLTESRSESAPVVARPSRWSQMKQAFNSPVLGGLMLLVFINTFAMAHIEASLFLLMQDQFAWTLKQASFGFAYIGLILVITQGFLIRKWMPKLGEQKLLLIGLVLSTLGFAGMAWQGSLGVLAVAVTLLGVGNGCVNPSLNGSISLLTGKEVQGNNLGIAQSLSSVARILGPPSGGYLYQHLGKPSPFAAAAVFVVLAALGVWKWRHRLPSAGAQKI